MIEAFMLILLLLMMILFGRAPLRRGLRTMMVLCLLIALASVGRWLMAALPSIQPASLIIMLAGFTMGPGAGLIVGTLTALLSNLLIGLSPYTLWQVFFWALMGFSSHKKIPLWLRPLFAFAWGFLFGWGMNLPYYSLSGVVPTWESYLAVCALSFPFDLAHAVTNAVLMASFGTLADNYFRNHLSVSLIIKL